MAVLRSSGFFFPVSLPARGWAQFSIWLVASLAASREGGCSKGRQAAVRTGTEFLSATSGRMRLKNLNG